MAKLQFVFNGQSDLALCDIRRFIDRSNTERTFQSFNVTFIDLEPFDDVPGFKDERYKLHFYISNLERRGWAGTLVLSPYGKDNTRVEFYPLCIAQIVILSEDPKNEGYPKTAVIDLPFFDKAVYTFWELLTQELPGQPVLSSNIQSLPVSVAVSESKPGRPPDQDNLWAYQQVRELGRKPEEVYPEWLDRIRERGKNLGDSRDSFNKAIRRKKRK